MAALMAMILCFPLLPQPAHASLSDGTIDANYKYAWNQNIGWVNFGDPAGNVHVLDTALTGNATSQSVGWISLNCANAGSCGAVDYQVANDSEGTLSGYAWSENIGWISFNCANTGSCAAVNYKVTIGTSGEFSGSAWSQHVGWISFNCSNTNACANVDYKVKTDWRPRSVRPPVGGSGPMVIYRPPDPFPRTQPPTTTPPVSDRGNAGMPATDPSPRHSSGEAGRPPASKQLKKFTRSLRSGVRHLDVRELQIHLNKLGFLVASSGPGSFGKETNFYGAGTRKAIQHFQCAHSIVCSGSPETTGYGVFGPRTRAKLNSLF